MGVQTAISFEEYLRTSFPDLDREYRDGEVLERTLPDYLHGRTQLRLGLIFSALSKLKPVYPCVETRMQLRHGHCLIPDVAVFYPEEPARVPDSPPLIV